MADQTVIEVASVTDLALSKPCREELHLWCRGKAGQHGRRQCGCTCHEAGRPLKSKAVA